MAKNNKRSKSGNAWLQLNRDTRKACDEALVRLTTMAEKDPFAQIASAFLHKATETLSAVNVLYAHDLQEPAQGLIRVLFEVRLNFDNFMRLAKDDVVSACHRVVDSMMLEKAKQARASNYGGMPKELIDRFEKYEEEIAAKYEHGELAQMKRHGFTGVSVEQRAALTGHETTYNIVYRNFSRNIHSTDYLESYLKTGVITVTDQDKYIESRDGVAHHIAHISAIGILGGANSGFGLGMDGEIAALTAREEEAKGMD